VVGGRRGLLRLQSLVLVMRFVRIPYTVYIFIPPYAILWRHGGAVATNHKHACIAAENWRELAWGRGVGLCKILFYFKLGCSVAY